MEDFNNKIENAINKEKFCDSFRNYFVIKFTPISFDKNIKELKQNKLYELKTTKLLILLI